MGPYAIAATALKTIIDTEFEAERIVAVHDRVHDSLGHDGIYVGIAPVREAPTANNRAVQETWIEIRFFDLWDKMIDPEQEVDPFPIAGRAERLRRAIKSAVTEGIVTTSGEMWFMHVDRVDYPDDPTGNKSRFVMIVRAWGNNSALVETGAP